MNQHRLVFELERVASRIRLLRFWQLMAAAWLVAAVFGLAMWGFKFSVGSQFGQATPLLCVVAIILALGGIWLAAMSARDHAWVAHRIESAFPELHTCLLAAVEQRPTLPDGRFGYLQASVIHQALMHADRHEWCDVVPMRKVATAALANVATLALFILVLAALAFSIAPSSTAAILGTFGHTPAGGGFSVVVEPGNAEIERGASLLVLARVTGQMPPEATLVFQPSAESASGSPASGGRKPSESDADGPSRLAMSASLDDPVFGHRIPIVDAPLQYHVELGGQTTPTYHVTVFEYPRLERADARLVYPSYTAMEPRVVQDVRTLSVVEGTELTLTCYLNKPVQSAKLAEEGAAPITLTKAPGSQPAYQMTLKCETTRRLKLELVDAEGRKNVKPAQFTISVLPNQPVALKPVFPARDLEVSPLEELQLKATAWDDFGVRRFGVAYSLSGSTSDGPIEVVLGESAAARQKHDLSYLVRLEDLKAQPDDLLSYHFWAEDFASDGSVRRSESDMYFAEVRPFDEIFRQGDQPPGGGQQGQGGNAQQAQQLAELQKQIINATWKLIRRETGSKLSDAFVSDTEQVHLSQSSALEQASALSGRLQDPESQEHIGNVIQAMQEAIDHLKAAHDAPDRQPLKPAMAAEQAAYQALLKLRAREHNIIRQNQRQRGARGGSGRSQQQRQQMQQLELRNDENRYETERTAQEQQDSIEERENRQVLNRLRELAQRQHDLNERLKELQSALEEARTAEQREELKRQLQRLQEEQRQILQDTEELQSRMDSPENLERMAAERQQLQETREQVQRASEALEETRISQAAASGTRAEQSFEDLRNEFRRRASGRFSEEMRQMREAARQLDEEQQQLSQRLAEASQPQDATKTKSLRDTSDREQIAEELTQQRQRLSTLQDEMRETIQDAEQTEPLLAEKLYDAVRQAQDQNIEQSLESAERSLRQGLLRDAQQQEQPAARGIGQLRDGIEQAAESVLGDETEALRRAREELQNLSDALNEEIQTSDPSRQRGSNQEAQPGPSQESERQQSDQQQGAQRGQDKKGEGKKGKGQRGEQSGKRAAGGKAGDDQPQSGEPNQPGQPGQRSSRQGRRLDGGADDNQNDIGPGGINQRMFAPLAGDGFREWSDRLRDVEEMIADPELRSEAARIRERARAIRADLRRHSADPNWELVQVQVAGPLVELRDRVAEELVRRTAEQAIVPLDRDPVPPKFTEKIRLYYERLGSGK